MASTPLSGARERDTLAALSQRHRASLQRYFERRLKVKSEIEDLIQEVFLRLARRSGFESILFLDGYLFEVAASVLHDSLRRRYARALDRHEEFRDDHAPAEFSPERVLIARESVELVAKALDELPERVRVAFALHRFEGLKHPAIAARLGVSVSAVEKYVIKALVHIKKCLDDPR
jgi:RNA polymerase sigma-70 factor (ECF subfamily)